MHIATLVESYIYVYITFIHPSSSNIALFESEKTNVPKIFKPIAYGVTTNIF